jgi:hypothetical protein
MPPFFLSAAMAGGPQAQFSPALPSFCFLEKVELFAA